MDTLGWLVLPFLITFAVIAVAIFLYVGQDKTAPVWIQKTTFRIRLLGKWLLKAVGVISLIYFVVLTLPYVMQEGAIWLAPGKHVRLWPRSTIFLKARCTLNPNERTVTSCMHPWVTKDATTKKP